MAASPLPSTKLIMLQRRSEFLRIRNGLRWATPAFVVEAKTRADWSPPVPISAGIVRFGFTVTKQMGSAVHRNRIRRRLKAAVQAAADGNAKPGFDYVVIARAPAETKLFNGLVADLCMAFKQLHSARGSATKPPGPRRKT